MPRRCQFGTNARDEAAQTEGYGAPFEWRQYELMAAKLRQIKCKAKISLNDHPDIRRCFEGSAWRTWLSTTPWEAVPTGPGGRS